METARSDNIIPDQVRRRIMESMGASGPNTDPRLQVTPRGRPEQEPVRYFIYADVLAELVKAARYRDGSATAVLLGQFCVDEEGPYVEITEFRQLQYLYGGDAVELMSPGVVELHEELAEADPEQGHGDARTVQVVGVFVACPGEDARLNPQQVRLHLSLFNLPYQAMLIVDGPGDKLAIYARRPGQPFYNASFYLVEPIPAPCPESACPADSGKDSKAVEMRNDETEHKEINDDGDRDCGVGGERDSGQSGQSDRGV